MESFLSLPGPLRELGPVPDPHRRVLVEDVQHVRGLAAEAQPVGRVRVADPQDHVVAYAV